MSSSDYLYTCGVCGTDFREMKSTETIYSINDSVSYCMGCKHNIVFCMYFTAARMPLEDIPLIISTLEAGNPLTILKYRLERGIESPASYEEYPVLKVKDKKYKEVCLFITEILGSVIMLGQGPGQ